MASSEQETREMVGDEQVVQLEQEIATDAQEDCMPSEEARGQEQGFSRSRLKFNVQGDKSSFIHGLSVGIGSGCIAAFVIMWIVVYFTPQLPSTVTYEAMLAIFIYPLIYLLAVGLVALTAGIVREYFVLRR